MLLKVFVVRFVEDLCCNICRKSVESFSQCLLKICVESFCRKSVESFSQCLLKICVVRFVEDLSQALKINNL